jgi:hypothetical protein
VIGVAEPNVSRHRSPDTNFQQPEKRSHLGVFGRRVVRRVLQSTHLRYRHGRLDFGRLNRRLLR